MIYIDILGLSAGIRIGIICAILLVFLVIILVAMIKLRFFAREHRFKLKSVSLISSNKISWVSWCDIFNLFGYFQTFFPRKKHRFSGKKFETSHDMIIC